MDWWIDGSEFSSSEIMEWKWKNFNMHLSTHSFINSFIHSHILHSFIHKFVIHSFIFVYSFLIHSLSFHSFIIHSFIFHELTFFCLIHSFQFFHSFTHSFIPCRHPPCLHTTGSTLSPAAEGSPPPPSPALISSLWPGKGISWKKCCSNMGGGLEGLIQPLNIVR